VDIEGERGGLCDDISQCMRMGDVVCEDMI
jgi:hypothetical protein